MARLDNLTQAEIQKEGDSRFIMKGSESEPSMNSTNDSGPQVSMSAKTIFFFIIPNSKESVDPEQSEPNVLETKQQIEEAEDDEDMDDPLTWRDIFLGIPMFFWARVPEFYNDSKYFLANCTLSDPNGTLPLMSYLMIEFNTTVWVIVQGVFVVASLAFAIKVIHIPLNQIMVCDFSIKIV